MTVRRGGLGSRLLLLIGSTAVTVLLAEIGARVLVHRDNVRTREALTHLGKAIVHPRSDGNMPLHGVLRLSTDPRRVYELIPDLKTRFKNQPVEINSLGFRGPPVTVRKTVGVRRLLGLGDSIQFGWGVAYEDTYIARLSTMLNAGGTTSAWETITAAVPGYNTAMEIATLKDSGLALQPDLVVIDFCINDFGLPNFLQLEPDVWSLREFYLGHYLTRQRIVHDKKRSWELVSAGFVHANWNKDRTFLEDDPGRAPKKYRDMVGTNAVVRALEEFKTLAVRHRFRTVMVSFDAIPDGVRSACDRLGIPTVTCVDAQARFVSSHAGSEDELRIPGDGHPSAVGHRLAAETYIEAFRKLGLLEAMPPEGTESSSPESSSPAGRGGRSNSRQ